MELKEKIKVTGRPYTIAGPCSAETESQVFKIAEELSLAGKTHLFRAGIWKPRTRPDSFEGVGEVGLSWLVDAGKQFKLPVTTEVANKTHVELALKAGVDVLWIGARTTVNPFAIQEIADALIGVKIPVMIKNPVNPDIELWLGAIERFEKTGNTDIIAIHRGFSVYKHPKYRNVPNWEIPIALKERRPDIPMICDPSHITGKRDLIAEVSQKAMDLNFNGLMIETHSVPDKAWSDAAQQITSDQLTEMLDHLILRSVSYKTDLSFELDEIRDKINLLDDRLFDLLSARMRLSEDAGTFKKKNNITILQEEHWAQLINRRLNAGNDLNLNERFIRQIMDAIHQESIRHQMKVMNPNINK